MPSLSSGDALTPGGAVAAHGDGDSPCAAAGGAAALFGDVVGSSTDDSSYSRFGIPQMIGDLGPGLSIPRPYPPTPPPTPPSPRRASALVPSVRGLKVSENHSPRPQDRVFFTFDYFSNVNGAFNLKLGAPVSDISLLTFGFVTPVTGPRPFDYEAVLLFNFRFGRSAVRATPPIISG